MNCQQDNFEKWEERPPEWRHTLPAASAMHQFMQKLVAQVPLEKIDSNAFQVVDRQIATVPPAVDTIANRCGERSSSPIRAQHNHIAGPKRVLEGAQLPSASVRRITSLHSHPPSCIVTVDPGTRINQTEVLVGTMNHEANTRCCIGRGNITGSPKPF